MVIGMHREQIGCCVDDTHFWRSCPKQREQLGECADDTHFWRSRPQQREQIGECADDTLFWRSRPNMLPALHAGMSLDQLLILICYVM